jgi:hypothetical protein
MTRKSVIVKKHPSKQAEVAYNEKLKWTNYFQDYLDYTMHFHQEPSITSQDLSVRELCEWSLEQERNYKNVNDGWNNIMARNPDIYQMWKDRYNN